MSELDKLAQEYIRTMNINTSRYWIIHVIAAGEYILKPYILKPSEAAKNFFEKEFPHLRHQETLSTQENQYIQAHLWRMFHNHNLDKEQRNLAGLCLRCYVSEAIVNCCRIIANKNLHAPNLFADMLSYVLNDDGRTFIVLDSDDKTQLKLSKNGETQLIPKEGNFQSIEILRTFKPNLYDSKKSENLDNWSIRITRQNKNLLAFLLEAGAKIFSDWSLLCKNIPRTLESHFTENQRHFIDVFHEVYRRDRRESCQRGRCLKPTEIQLEQMRCLLQNKKIIVGSANELIRHFKEIAEILRQDEYYTIVGVPIGDSIETLSLKENENENENKKNTDNSFSILNKYYDNNLYPEDIEKNELINLLAQLSIRLLHQVIPFQISERVAYLATRRNYSLYAPKFTEALGWYYRIENPLTLQEIANKLEITWAKARRIFKFSEFIEENQSCCEKRFMEIIQEKAGVYFANEISCNPNMLRDIGKEIRNYLYKEVFQKAYAELIASRQPYKTSLFAQVLRHCINN